MHFKVHDPAAANQRGHPLKLQERRGVPEQPEKPTLAQGLRLTRGRRRRFGRRRVCSPNSSPGCRPPAFRVKKGCKAIPSWTSRITPAAPEIAGELVGVGSHKDTEPTLTLARLAHLHARFALPDKEEKKKKTRRPVLGT